MEAMGVPRLEWRGGGLGSPRALGSHAAPAALRAFPLGSPRSQSEPFQPHLGEAQPTAQQSKHRGVKSTSSSTENALTKQWFAPPLRAVPQFPLSVLFLSGTPHYFGGLEVSLQHKQRGSTPSPPTSRETEVRAVGLLGGKTSWMGLGDFPWDNGASNWGLSPPRAARAGACSTEPSLGFRVNTGMHHLYGQGEEHRLSWGGCMRQSVCIQPPPHCTGLGGGGGVLQGGFSQPCRASAAVPSTGIPHSCFLPPNLTGTSGGAGSSPPPTPPTAASCTALHPPSPGHCSHGSPQGQPEPPGVPLPLQDAHPGPDPAAAFPPPICIPWGVLLPPSLPHPPPFWGSPLPHGS